MTSIMSRWFLGSNDLCYYYYHVYYYTMFIIIKCLMSVQSTEKDIFLFPLTSATTMLEVEAITLKLLE